MMQAIANREEIRQASTYATQGDEHECNEYPQLVGGGNPVEERRVSLHLSVIADLMSLGSGDLSRGIEQALASASAGRRRYPATPHDY